MKMIRHAIDDPTLRGLLALLEGAWRADAGPPGGAAGDLRRAVARLVDTGAGALAWRRLRCDPELAACFPELRQAYRMTALHTALVEQRVSRAFELLRAAGVEPVLGKGWAAARLYPEPGLRPYGDVDLYVPPGQAQRARAALRQPDAEGCRVDLHAGAAELNDRSWHELYLRSRIVPLHGTPIRVFGAEDHLRLLSLHALRHGLRRPLWLCDLGAALEARPHDFNWDHVLGGDRRRADWAVCAWLLARDLLGARLEGAPAEVRGRVPPRWIRTAVLLQWSRGDAAPQGARAPLWPVLLRRPGDFLAAVRRRWPNPVEATVGVGAPMNRLPRLPFQLADWAWRAVRFAARPDRYLASS